ncbi:MAG: nitroreductase family protein [Bacteroidota bacterium]|nr:nitroreductase family protein [Bacteroidota bacterium]
MISEIVRKCRSYRRFFQDVPVAQDDLLEMVDNARLSASARNAQSLKYIVANEADMNDKIFSCLAWAGYLKDWNGPEKGEQPSAYIIMLNDTDISTNYWCDHGIAAQSILLTAVEKGLGGCIIGSVKREMLRHILFISEQYEIVQVIAIGKPKEEVRLDPLGSEGDIKYWRDAEQVHHVPKRSLEDIVLNFK